MLANKDGPGIRWVFWLLALALLLGGAITARVALASAGNAAPAAGVAGAPLTTYLSTDVPKSIPISGTVTSTLLIPVAGTISSVDVVSVEITHTFPGDLKVYLISPANTRVLLLNNICAGDDWTVANTGFSLSDGAVASMGDTCPPGNGRYKPAEALSAFAGQSMQGTWTLEINDNTDEDNGGLIAWGLAIPGAAPQATPTPSVEPTLVPEPPATPCPINFSDVHPTDYFYGPVRYLFCKGAISGYGDNTFRPYGFTTRGQMAKIVVLGLDVPILAAPATPTYIDVPASNPFFRYVEAATEFGIVSGYADHTFRPFATITRGQLVKMAVNGAGWDTISPATQRFTDVPPSDPYYAVIETAACYNVISGYADGTFREGLNVTRGQTAKILANTETASSACPLVPTPIGRPQP